MNDIDHYLEQACRQIIGPDSLRQHLRKELKEHLVEAIDVLVAEGMSRDDATKEAIDDLGDAESIRDGMQSVYDPGITSLFVEQAIKWKDNRWHRVAQIGLVLNILLAILFPSFVLIKIVPVLAHEYMEPGVEMPRYLQATIEVSGFIVNNMYVWPIALVSAVGLFEWKCRSENKPLIRTSILVGFSLVSVVGAFWVAGVTGVSFAIM